VEYKVSRYLKELETSRKVNALAYFGQCMCISMMCKVEFVDHLRKNIFLDTQLHAKNEETKYAQNNQSDRQEILCVCVCVCVCEGGGGGEWYGRPRRHRPRGGKINI